MNQQIPKFEYLKPLYDQVKDLELGQLLSGLTLLVKDTAIYLTANGIDDDAAEGFRLAYFDMLNDNRYYREKFGALLYGSLRNFGPVEGYANGASKCEDNLFEKLMCDKLNCETLRAPGWRFFVTYSGQRKNDILSDITFEQLKTAFCEGKNPYCKADEDGRDKEDNEPCDPEEKDPYKPIEGLVKRLVGTDRLSNAFWYPVMLYMALLIQNTDFTTLE